MVVTIIDLKLLQKYFFELIHIFCCVERSSINDQSLDRSHFASILIVLDENLHNKPFKYSQMVNALIFDVSKIGWGSFSLQILRGQCNIINRWFAFSIFKG